MPAWVRLAGVPGLGFGEEDDELVGHNPLALNSASRASLASASRRTLSHWAIWLEALLFVLVLSELHSAELLLPWSGSPGFESGLGL